MLNNTDKNYSIIHRKSFKKIMVTSGIVVTSLFLNLVSSQKDTNKEEKQAYVTTEESGYNLYSSIYLDILENIDDSQFDQKFIEIYQNAKLKYLDQEYGIDQIYLKTMEDGSRHYIIAGINKIDFLTQNQIEGNRVSTSRFRDSSIFYQMYLDGIITLNETTIDPVVFQQYLNQWDGELQQQVPTLKAQIEADSIYKRKYGR